MTKRVVIHAGPGKTGTSVIQNWLVNNTEVLAQNKVFYPNHGLDANGVSSGNIYAVLSKDCDNKFFVDEQKVNRLLSDFEASPYEVLLLSSEFFFYKISELKQYFNNATFIIYLRNPLELLESNYNQSVKRHTKKERFSMPYGFKFQLLDDLDKLLADRIDLVIRPYDTSLFYHGNIVSDLLNVFDVDIKVDELRRVNPSYVYQSLEFKRLLNHFPLQEVESEIDRVMQSYSHGDSAYSLIPPKLYDNKLSELVIRVNQFIGLHELSQLTPWIENITNNERNPYFSRELTADELLGVAAFLELESPAIFEHIRRAVLAHPDLFVSNSLIYDCFNVMQVKKVETNHFTEISSLSKILLSNTVSDPAEVTREIALYFERIGDVKTAREFMAAAHIFRPNGPQIKLKLNHYNTTLRSIPPLDTPAKGRTLFSKMIKTWVSRRGK
ncbi:hypothetical protein [Shewanella goraebulensis]|uniref:hypothetical protein n=1 Tax=Shewanella goraebulensis TaxID=3050637 RepID=UPI00254FCB29|nr:hypothetical protein [Shewanella goraebulensis]